MSIFHEWARRLWGTLSGRRRDADFEEELRLHLELVAEEARRQGHSPEQAVRLARLEAGGMDQAMEAMRDQRGLPWLEDMFGDSRIAVRMMRRSPIFSAVAVLSLAIGIGANTAIFSLLNTLLLRPLPVHQPDRLVEVLSQFPGEPRTNGFSWPVYEHYRDQNHVFSDLFAMSPAQIRIGDPSSAVPMSGEYVTGNFFAALGVTPAIGRLIGPADLEPGADPVVVIGWQLWQDRFSASPAVLGQPLVMNGLPTTIVGVAPKPYRGIVVGFKPQFWLPLSAERRAAGSAAVAVMARLKPGVTIEQARAEMQILDRYRIEEMARRSPNLRKLTIDLEPARSGFALMRDRYATPLVTLAAIVGLMLLVACTNVAGALLARSAARHREMAVRVSVGASRWRLVRQMMTESLLLSGAGGLLGIGVAYLGVNALVGVLISGRTLVGGLGPIQLDPQLDTEALVFSIVVAVMTGLLFGLAPAWHAFKSAPGASLRVTGSAAETPARRLASQGLIVAQVALSMVLLSAAAVFINHLSNLRNVGLGFDRQSVLLMTIDPARTGHALERLSAPYRDLLTRISAIPNVQSATISAVTPIHGAGASRFVNVPGVQEPEDRMRTLVNWVAPKYFETFGTPLIAGRDFAFEDEGRQRVAIINQAAEKYYFGSGSALGRRFTLEGIKDQIEIVGVVADAKYLTLREPAPRSVYLNLMQESRMIAHRFSVRTSIDPSAIGGDVRRAATELFKLDPVSAMTTLADQMDAEIVPERMVAMLSGLFGILGAALAGLGLYGLLAYTVTRRTNEIGVRIALGATQGRVIAMVVKSATSMVIAGLVVGVPIAVGIRRLAAGFVAGVQIDNTLAIGVAAMMMVLVAVLSAFVPARRAALIDPATALRQD
jgi:predicted permease